MPESGRESGGGEGRRSRGEGRLLAAGLALQREYNTRNGGRRAAGGGGGLLGRGGLPRVLYSV